MIQWSANPVIVLVTATLSVVGLAWFLELASWISLWPVIAGFIATLAACVVLVWLVPGRWVSLAWGLGGGLILVLETLWRNIDLPENGMSLQAVAWAFGIAATAGAGFFSAAGWQAGIRAGLASQLAATLGWVVVLGFSFGQPWLAAALDLGGAVDRFAGTPALVFWTWVAEDFWRGIALRMVLATLWGALLGWLGGLVGDAYRRRKYRAKAN